MADQIKNNIQNKISQNEFTIKYFVEQYNEYYLQGQNIARIVSYFNDRVYSNNTNKYSHVGLIRNFTFYNNVINQKYIYPDGNSYYIYEIFNKVIENGECEMEQITHLFKMYSFYIKLSHIAKEQEKLFNNEIDKLFLVTLGSNTDFIKMLTSYIHVGIKDITTNQNDKTRNNIISIIDLVINYFLEKDMFILYYEQLLEQRLLSANSKIDLDLEKAFISRFKNAKDHKVMQRMIYKLEDLETAIRDKKFYDHMEVNIGSNKYKGKINKEDIDLQKVNFRLFRNYAWSQTGTNSHQLSVPFDMQPYTDIYIAFCKKKYPHRDIQYNFENGTGVLKFNSKNKQYFIQLTIPQMFLLLQFNDSDKIKAHELATNMGIPLSKLGPILSSLLKPKILLREQNKNPNDIDMFIYLNTNFEYNGTHISFVNLMTNPKKEQAKQKEVDVQIAHQVELEKENLMRAAIVRTMKHNKELSKDNLYQKMKEACKFEFDEKYFMNILDSCIEEKYVKKIDDNNYEYLIDDDDF